VLAVPADDSYGAASAKIVVEEGASFKDNTPQTEVSHAMAPVSKVDYGPIAKVGLIILAVVIVVFAVIRAVKKSKQKGKEDKQ
jgi:hypothetical protein